MQPRLFKEEKSTATDETIASDSKIKLDWLDAEYKEWFPKIQTSVNKVLDLLKIDLPTAEKELQTTTKLIQQYCDAVLEDAPVVWGVEIKDGNVSFKGNEYAYKNHFLAQKIDNINFLMKKALNEYELLNSSLGHPLSESKKTSSSLQNSDPLQKLIFECEILPTHIEKRTIDKKAEIVREPKCDPLLEQNPSQSICVML